jgi:hypothetical protein
MSFQNLVRLSHIKIFSLPDFAHVNKVSNLSVSCQNLSSLLIMQYFKSELIFSFVAVYKQQSTNITIGDICGTRT